jgi:uncharacterized protein GlcG (DUF336 family)
MSKHTDFSDLSPHDAIALVANSAVVARESGHPVEVAVARRNGVTGILVWMPGYLMQNGAVVATGGKVATIVANDKGQKETTP